MGDYPGIPELIFGGLYEYTIRRIKRAESRYSPAGEFVRVEGCRLHYMEQGSGQTVILLSGDSGGFQDVLLSPHFGRLTREYRELAFDRPGLGYSERPPDGVYLFSRRA